MRETLGYSSEEALAPDWWFDRVNALDRARVVGIVTELSKNGTASREYRFSRKDGSVVWLHDEMRLFSGGEGGPEIVGTLTDVTGRKKAEEEIHLKSSALDAAANAVVITDRVGRIEWANPAFSALTGYSVAEAAGMVPGNLVQSGRQDKEFYRRMWDTILSGKVWSGRIVNKRKSGELYDEEMTITPVLDESFNVSHFIAVKNDVTESELARKRLEGALREKEDLLREIHHRVNNNMQVIISLFNVSAQDIGDPALRLKQADFVQRIQAMALIHGQFYDSKDISRIDFAAYLRQLANKLGTAYPDSARRLEVDCGADEVFLHLEQAIPAGLIVEELLINALKHAFPSPRDDGRIGISQRLTGDGKLAVEVRDNGVGVGDGVDLARANTLGMLLVRALATQVGATISFENEGGTVATMRLPLPSGEGGKLTT